MKNLETNRKPINGQPKKYSTLRTWYLELVSSVAEDSNKDIRGCGPGVSKQRRKPSHSRTKENRF